MKSLIFSTRAIALTSQFAYKSCAERIAWPRS
jgi:hypothetical protein